MKNTIINSVNNTNTNSVNKGEITMKKSNKKMRIIAGILSVITIFSIAAFTTTTASAAETETNSVVGIKKMPMDKFSELVNRVEREKKEEAERKERESEDADFREGRTVVVADGEEKEYTDFTEAWNAATAANEAKVMVNSDLNDVETLTIPSGKKISVNLKCYTVKAKGDLFKVESGAELFLKRGTINDAHTAVIANGSTNLDRVRINNSLDSAVKGGEGAKVVIDGCTFCDNKGVQGGAVYLPYYADGTGINNSVFEGNSAEREGGAVFTNRGLTNCTFRNNEAGSEGGAVYITGNKETLGNSTFDNNFSGSNGGAVAVSNEFTYFKSCAFNSNKANGSGGALYTPENKDMELYSCFVVGNHADGNGGGIYTSYRSHLRLTYVRVYDNTANGTGGGIYLGALRSKYHWFSDITVSGNEAQTAGGIYADAGFACAADIDIDGKIEVKGNCNDDLYLMKASGQKAKLYTNTYFYADESCIYVNSADKGEIGVVDLKDRRHDVAFHGNAGRSVYRGSFFYETLYLK